MKNEIIEIDFYELCEQYEKNLNINLRDLEKKISNLNNSLAAISKQIETSEPDLNPALFIASKINSIASSLLDNDGANPPSSPTEVERFLLTMMDLNFCITKKHMFSASLKVLALSGRIINS